MIKRTKFRHTFVGELLTTAAMAAIVCAACAGCQKVGYERVAVSGQVLIDGAPLTFGSVRFFPVGGGRPSVANIGADGRFDFGKEGVVVGKQRIEVIASEQVGATGYRWHAPEKYASYSTSGLAQVIDKPTSDVALKLTWGGKRPTTVQGVSGDDDPKNFKGRR